MKVVYVAAAQSLPTRDVRSAIGKFAADCLDPNCLDGMFFTKQHVPAGMDEYPNKDREETVGALMELSRRFDEVWLVGPDVPDEEFDAEFRMELRVAKHDGIMIRRFRIADGAIGAEEAG